MITKELIPPVNCTIEFDYTKHLIIPQEYGCYVISNFNEEIMYIGKAINLHRRFSQHIEDKSKNGTTNLGKPYWFSFRTCSNEFEISKLERGWLNHYELITGNLPFLNKIHAG